MDAQFIDIKNKMKQLNHQSKVLNKNNQNTVEIITQLDNKQDDKKKDNIKLDFKKKDDQKKKITKQIDQSLIKKTGFNIINLTSFIDEHISSDYLFILASRVSSSFVYLEIFFYFIACFPSIITGIIILRHPNYGCSKYSEKNFLLVGFILVIISILILIRNSYIVYKER